MSLQTFIFVHDQNIITDFISTNKFKNLDDLTYVFLGSGEIDKIKELNNVIISRNLPIQIEEYNSNLIAFTGWYSLWKNDLIKSSFVNLFEYDININENLYEIIQKKIYENPLVGSISYIPLNIHDYYFLGIEEVAKNLLSIINKTHSINGRDFIKNFPKDLTIGVTSNQTFRKDVFTSFMEWMEPLIEDMKNDRMSPHYPERTLPLYLLFKKIPYLLVSDVLFHFQMDSHKTQGKSNEYKEKNYLNILGS